jgi:hypothetical protein
MTAIKLFVIFVVLVRFMLGMVWLTVKEDMTPALAMRELILLLAAMVFLIIIMVKSEQLFPAVSSVVSEPVLEIVAK